MQHNKILMNINESGPLEYKNLNKLNHNLDKLEFRISEDCQTFDHMQQNVYQQDVDQIYITTCDPMIRPQQS